MKKQLILICILIAGVINPAICQAFRFPRYAHVIIIIEENHGYDELIGSSNAPYINEIARQGALFTNSHGIGHPSQPNYLVLFSGSTQGTTDDNCLINETPYHTPNLGAALIKKGFTFKGYAQTMPTAGYLGCTYLSSKLTVGNLYARKHTPWVNWLGNGVNNIPASLSLPMTSFPHDFRKLPKVCFVIPDMDYDMHNIGAQGDAAAVQRGDKWLKKNLGAYVKWAKTHNSLLILTFDEDDYRPQNQNKIPTIILGAKVKIMKVSDPVTHYNLLHTLQAMYGLPVIDAVSAAPVTKIWKTN